MNNKCMRRVAAVFLAAAAAVSIAMPQRAEAADFRGWFVDFGAGQYRFQHDFQGSATSNNKASRLYAGYQFFDFLAVEGGWVDFDEGKISSGGVPVEIETEGYHIKGIASLPFGRDTNGFNAVFLSVGAWRWDYEAKNNVTGVRVHGVSPTAGVGFMIGRKTASFKLEYERFVTSPDVSSGVFGAAYGVHEDNYQDLISLNLMFYL